MLWPQMTEEGLELIRNVVRYANNVAYDYDMQVEITEEAPDFVGIRTINDEGETDQTATLRVLGDYNYEDRRVEGEESRVVDNTLLGLWIDGERDDRRWRIFDARATSLFALLYVG
jgi:hypothetical protein